MKRLFSIALFGAAAALLGGCPVYPDNPSGYRVCDGNTCWSCPTDNISNQCSPWSCQIDSDCQQDYYCGNNGTCASYGADDAGVPPPPVDATSSVPVPTSCTQPSNCGAGYTCGAGGACELGDCSVTGCVSGYACELENGVVQCFQQQQPVDAGTADASVACQTSADCVNTSAGALCLDGMCVAPANQCFDGSQCPSGDKCVQGACTPTCSSSTDGGASLSCPTGYSCADIDDASSAGVCSGNPSPCEANPAVCPTGTLCSQNHCVTSCTGGAACATGEVCLQGGCVPEQIPAFTCGADGVQDLCDPGSICLHHSCYIACNPDAGTACQSEGQLDECKPVTASGGTYFVCGSSSNLGTECNPTTGQLCSNTSSVCIDGFCY